jgi:hypothetical protein
MSLKSEQKFILQQAINKYDLLFCFGSVKKYKIVLEV